MTDLKGGHGATIGAQLRRLSERIDRDVSRVYKHLGITFEQRWFGVLNQIVENGPMTVGHLAAALRVTHVSVSQSLRSLEAAGYVRALPDPLDARRRRQSLTGEGEALVARLTPLWLAMNSEAEALNREADDVAARLNRLDEALDRNTLYNRLIAVVEVMDKNQA
ncbi:MarR family winged helix-turn-helix transcriptional regulator [Novosphingobium sp. RL4]|uniref:MarR family winged helix-turn-helix transcriptional regulator n=1 Tax=Novosphingobium sp. RL4 TaxID=3109595 RepID=UPI002D77AB1E|nr:MarR family transcriptional regulator [Novosphingobium sp. RL4]WRT94462.1 MarR family transcriptional regulator [Novosphingobium sp. RL4]